MQKKICFSILNLFSNKRVRKWLKFPEFNMDLTIWEDVLNQFPIENIENYQKSTCD